MPCLTFSAFVPRCSLDSGLAAAGFYIFVVLQSQPT